MLLASLLSLALVPQGTWIVDQSGGPGTHFNDVPAAVAAAASGDTILVRGPGSYSGFTCSGKALTIRGEGEATCSTGTIRSTPPGSVFALVGMRLFSLVIDNSNASIDNCFVSSAYINNGGQVAMAYSTCAGSNPMVLDNGSTLVASRSRFLAPDYSRNTNSNCISYDSSAGITANRSRVSLHDCSVAGGTSLFYMSAGGFGGCLYMGTWPWPGIVLNLSSLRVTGTGTNLTGTPRIVADAGTQITTHGNVGSLGSFSAALVTHTASLPVLRVDGTRDSNGAILATSPVTVTLNGPIPGAPALLAFDVSPPTATTLPAVLGDVMLPVSSYFLATTLDGLGHFTVTFPGLQVPWLGIPVFGQAAVLDPLAAQFLMSNLELPLLRL